MEPACLRIKFTPLFNNALKNGSKCCLEIVPEVSCVQNLDKISWKQEKNLIEYTIPMTYKIILKKQENLKKENDVQPVDGGVLDKTYHSCVDLLPASSLTAFDFASGDVARIISDTFILGKISAKFDDNNSTPLLKPVNLIKTNENQIIDRPKETFLDHIVEQTVLVDDGGADSKQTNGNNLSIAIPRHRECDSYDQHLLKIYSLDKITNTEHVLTACKVTETESVETTTEISTRSRDDSKRKLSLSPICSINANGNPFPATAEVIPVNLVVNRIYEYGTKDFSENVTYDQPSKIDIPLVVEAKNYDHSKFMENVYKPRKRELPEARVAKFIKKMETEIMPLKIMLNEIVQKCSTLGLYKNKYITRNLILYKAIPSNKNHSSNNQIEMYCKTERQTKSNRVVYSIVFEG